jgi:hypothetical protein
MCAQCGYNLRGLKREGLCPECGFSIEASVAVHRREVDPAWKRRWALGLDIVLLCMMLSAVVGAISWGMGMVLLGPWVKMSGRTFLGLSTAWCTVWTVLLLSIGARGLWLFGELGQPGYASKWSWLVRWGMPVVMACVGAMAMLWLVLGDDANFMLPVIFGASSMVVLALCRHGRAMLELLRVRWIGGQLRVLAWWMAGMAIAWGGTVVLILVLLAIESSIPFELRDVLQIMLVICIVVLAIGQFVITPVMLVWLMVLLVILRVRLRMRIDWTGTLMLGLRERQIRPGGWAGNKGEADVDAN